MGNSKKGASWTSRQLAEVTVDSGSLAGRRAVAAPQSTGGVSALERERERFKKPLAAPRVGGSHRVLSKGWAEATGGAASDILCEEWRCSGTKGVSPGALAVPGRDASDLELPARHSLRRGPGQGCAVAPKPRFSGRPARRLSQRPHGLRRDQSSYWRGFSHSVSAWVTV